MFRLQWYDPEEWYDTEGEWHIRCECGWHKWHMDVQKLDEALRDHMAVCPIGFGGEAPPPVRPMRRVEHHVPLREDDVDGR